MTQSLVHTLRYVSAAGDGEAHWIRLEQERTDEAVTVEEAAEFMDSLYGIDSCERGISGDGDAAGDDPEEERFDTAAAALMGDAVCAESEYWTAYVRVYRSHQSPGYVLRSATATVESVEPGIRESVREIVETPGNSHDLELPFAGDLVLPPGVRGEVRGSTLNLSRPATGPLVVRYTTVYDRVTLHVPVTATAAQGDEGQALRAALDAAGLVAFQGEGARAIAAATALEPPAQDESVSAAELERLCRRERSVSYQVVGDCWQTIEHYNKCVCRDTEAPGGWSEQTPVPCPQGVAAGTHIGTVRKMDGYVRCPGEEDEELHDPEFYKRVCCEYPRSPSDLPTCRRRYQIWRGGAEIEGGAAHWRDQYGPDVRLVAVTPPDGICGQLIHEWNVTRRNCCDDVVPLSPSPDNPDNINPGGTYLISVQDGRPGPLTWRATGGLRFVDTGGTTYVTTSRGVHVNADANICPSPRVTVDDGCYPVTLVFRGPDDTTGPALDADSLEVRPESDFAVSVSGGLAPYMWIATGTLQVLGYSPDGQTLFVRTASIDSWCVETVTVVDQCGREDSCDIYNAAAGSWREVPREEYDVCSPPGAPFALDYENVNYIYSKPSGGYRAVVAWTRQQQWERYGGSCTYRQNPDAWLNCATGNIIVRGSATGPNRPGYCTGSSGNWRWVMVGPACCRYYNVNSSTSDLYTSWWQYTQWLYRWYCGEQGDGGG